MSSLGDGLVLDGVMRPGGVLVAPAVVGLLDPNDDRQPEPVAGLLALSVQAGVPKIMST